MYVNPASAHFDPNRQFAWMRGYDGSAMAIVANFADHPVDVEVMIPREAFDYLGLPPVMRTVHFHVGAHDYTRIDVSHLG